MNSRNRAKHQKILESKTAKLSGSQAVFGICVCSACSLCVFPYATLPFFPLPSCSSKILLQSSYSTLPQCQSNPDLMIISELLLVEEKAYFSTIWC